MTDNPGWIPDTNPADSVLPPQSQLGYAERMTMLEAQDGAPSTPSRGKSARAWAATWPQVLAIALILIVWELIHLTGWKKFVLPGPGVTLTDLGHQAEGGQLWQAIGITGERAVLGFALAAVIGMVIGALVSRIPPLRAAIGSIITALQTMPSIAWFPFAIILFGQTTNAILFVTILGAAPSVANGLIAGVDYTPPLLLRAGATMGLGRIALWRHLILPASLPSLINGLKQGWAFAWRSLMAGELLVLVSGQVSLGVLLNNSQSQLDMPGAISLMIVILIVGIVVHLLFGQADKAVRRRWGLAASQ